MSLLPSPNQSSPLLAYYPPPPLSPQRITCRSLFFTFKLWLLAQRRRPLLLVIFLFGINLFLIIKSTNLFKSHVFPVPEQWHRLLPKIASTFDFAGREPGNFAPITSGIAPRDPPLSRKLGLIAVSVGIPSLPVIAPVLQLFHQHGFDVMVFHYDDGDSVWTASVPEYKHWTAISAPRQSKFWFAKRFLSPPVVENYDYLFLWDDDVGLPQDWSPTSFVQLLKDHHIHIGQPALLSGQQRNWQRETVSVHNNTNSIGRFSSFVEVMFPVFSKAAWPCAWRLLPFDGVSFWGTDNAWYPVCSSHGLCRFAIIDAMPVHHLDKRSLGQNLGVNLNELDHYRTLINHPCKVISAMNQSQIMDPFNIPRIHVSVDHPEFFSPNSHPTVSEIRGKPWIPTPAVRTVCNYLDQFPLGRKSEFYSIRNISSLDFGGSKQCPEPHLFDAKPLPWWGSQPDPPPATIGYWIGKDEELMKVREIKRREIEDRKKLGGKKGSW